MTGAGEAVDQATVAELVAATIARLGAGHVFGVVGSGNFALVNALRAAGVPWTSARHEGGAATMADAFARVSGRLAVVSTHQGCGYTNALTGIAEAAKSRTPLLVLTAAAPMSARYNNFQMDQDGAARSVGAVAERVHSAATAATDTERAWRTAVLDRRTVVLSVPIDLLSHAAPGAPGPTTPPPPRRVRPCTADLDVLLGLLDDAARPVFIAGRGAREAGAGLAELARRTGALVATSAVVKGLFVGDEADLGISGGFSTPVAAELIEGADLVVAWGCALNGWTTRHGRLLGVGAKIVQIDVDPLAIGAHRPVDAGVVGDTAAVAEDALAALRERNREGYRSTEVLARIAAERTWQDVGFDDLGDASHVDPRTVTIALDDALPAERIVAVDSGNFMGYPSQFLDVPDVDGFCFTQAFQSIGLGLATAIGAAVARPDRVPVLGTGDGGFLMSIAELETAVRLGIPLVVLVYNDAAYSAEVHHFGAGSDDADGPDLDTVVFPDTDLAALARGFGAMGLTVRSDADLPAMVEAVREVAAMSHGRGRPLVIDAKIASDGGSWWLAEAFRAH